MGPACQAAQLRGQQVKRTYYTAGSETAVRRCMTTAARRCISAQQAGARTGRLAQAGGSPGQQGCLARQHTQKRGCSQVRGRSRTAGQEGVRAASRTEVLAALAADRAERSAAAPSQGSKAQARPLAWGFRVPKPRMGHRLFMFGMLAGTVLVRWCAAVRGCAQAVPVM